MTCQMVKQQANDKKKRNKYKRSSQATQISRKNRKTIN